MEIRKVDEEISLVPYYPIYEVTLEWYQDLSVTKQVDNIDFAYTLERLEKMYKYLSEHGVLYYIVYKGEPVGDIALHSDGEVCMVVSKNFQNRHIGRRALKNLIEFAKDEGYTELSANIYSFNHQSRNMIEAVGFIKVDEENYIYHIK